MILDDVEEYIASNTKTKVESISTGTLDSLERVSPEVLHINKIYKKEERVSPEVLSISSTIQPGVLALASPPSSLLKTDAVEVIDSINNTKALEETSDNQNNDLSSYESGDAAKKAQVTVLRHLANINTKGLESWIVNETSFG